MKRILSFLVLSLLAICPTVTQVAAQDGPSADCASEDMVAAIETLEDALARAKQAATDGDLTTSLDLLTEASRLMMTTQAQCRGWYFEGNGSDVLGPLELGGGIYVLEYASSVPSGLVSMGMLTIEFEPIEHDESIWDQVMEMRTEAGEFSGRKTFRLSGGRYLISMEAMYLGDWTIQLVKP